MGDDAKAAALADYFITMGLATAHSQVPGLPEDVDHAVQILDRADDSYWFDLKWDGVRVMAIVTDGEVHLRNRNRKFVTDRYPDVVETLKAALPTGTYVLDGEVVAFGEDGQPDFGLVSRRDRVGSPEKAAQAAKRLPVTYVAFDVVFVNGWDLEGVDYVTRRTLLETHVEPRAGLVVSPASNDGETMWAFCRERGLEGLIAKRADAHYPSGRSRAWIKLKAVSRVTCLVTGMAEGNGKASGMMGKLHLGLWDGSTVVDVGKVGTGFSDDDRRAFWAYKDDVGDLPPVEVEYLNVTPDGVLRFPSFKGTRSDIDGEDCTIDQLTANQGASA